MKKTLLTILSVLFCAITFAQSVPQGINYQAVARDANGDVLMNQALTIQFSVISDITTSAVSWQETHTVNTNDYGLYTAIIGQGIATSVGSSATFDVIDWGASNHLLKVEVDFGSGYLDMGTTAFMSVPYSMNASNVDPTDELQSLSISGDTLFISSGNYIVLPSSAPTLLGCTDPTAFNYDAAANTDDGSCIAVVNGCTDSTAYSGYNPLANTDDGSCVAVALGCTDSTSWYYDPLANTDDGSCQPNGMPCDDGDLCTSGETWNSGICDGGSPVFCDDGNPMTMDACNPISGCQFLLMGCTDSTALNYDSLAVVDDGSCIAVVNGCTDSTAFNYNPLANSDDGSCTYSFTGAIGDTYQGGIVFYILQPGDIGYVVGQVNGLIAAPSDQGQTEWGCYVTAIAGADGIAIGTGTQNTIDIEAGCTTAGTAADICANYTDGTYSDWFLPSKDELNEMYVNLYLQGLGSLASNGYWSSTEFDDLDAWFQGFSSGYQGNNGKWSNKFVRAVRAFGPVDSTSVNGCTDPTAFNYDASANTDDGSCIAVVNGCTDTSAANYNSAANVDDGSCIAAALMCCNTSSYGSATASDYSQVQIHTCNYLTEYSTISGVLANTSYTAEVTGANAAPGWITVYEGSSCGNFISKGASPLTFNSTVAGTYYIHWSVDNTCATATGCHVTTITGNNPPAGCTDSLAFNFNPLANTDDGSCNYSLDIGDTHQGGIIFWLDGNGGGLIAAPSSNQGAAKWGCYQATNEPNLFSGANGTAIGTGTQNTIDIINANCTSSNGSPTAADICANLTLGGYSDWFLPSKDELNEMYLSNIGVLDNNALYWSSTNYSTFWAWTLNTSDGSQYGSSKDVFKYVRPVRAF